MKVGIIGGSASGIYAALRLKANDPHCEVTIFEREQKLGKKLYATGNGRCNLLHENPSPESYTNPEIFASLLKKYPFEILKKQIKEWGIALKTEGYLDYPASLSAPSFVHYLERLVKEAGINVVLETAVFDYVAQKDFIEVLSSKGKYRFDKVFICVGGKSGKNLGSDGSFFSILQNHGYRITPLVPGLAPIKVSERVASLSGQRHEASISIQLQKESFTEKGELLFKKDALSGIVCFNAESFLASREARKGTEIVVDLFPSLDEKDLAEEWLKASARSFYLDAYFSKEMQNYLKSRCSGKPSELAHLAKHLVFHYQEPYPFSDSQVTIGGVDWCDVDSNKLESKIEKNVYFLGECLDIAGDCGGFNLTWCLLSALVAADSVQ